MIYIPLKVFISSVQKELRQERNAVKEAIVNAVAHRDYASLPEPTFEHRGGQFVTTLWRDWVTERVINSLELNDRQLLLIKKLKIERQITTRAYQHLAGCSRRTVARDLDELLKKRIIKREGVGRSAYYILMRNRAIILPNVPSQKAPGAKLNERKSIKDNKPTIKDKKKS